MDNRFNAWLEQNGLTLAFSTSAGDCVYVNRQKMFGVLKKYDENGAISFYLDYIVGFETYDDEILVARWNRSGLWGVEPKGARYSTSQVYVKMHMRDGRTLRVTLFKALEKNIDRQSDTHQRLYTYACQMSQCVYNLAVGK